MMDSTYLTINLGKEKSQARVVELSGGKTVRVGKGEACEVRLDDPAMGDVQCVLRKRGLTWYVEPVGPAGHLKLEGREVSGPRSVPLGVPLQVGAAWLTIQTQRRGRAGFEPVSYGGHQVARPTVAPTSDLSPPPSPASPKLEPRASYRSARLSSGGEQGARPVDGGDRLGQRSDSRPGYSMRGREPAQARRPLTLRPVPGSAGDRPRAGLSSGAAFREQPVTPARPVARLHESLREAITRVQEERAAFRRAAPEVERPVREAKEAGACARLPVSDEGEEAFSPANQKQEAIAWLKELLDRPMMRGLPAPERAVLEEVGAEVSVELERAEAERSDAKPLLSGLLEDSEAWRVLEVEAVAGAGEVFEASAEEARTDEEEAEDQRQAEDEAEAIEAELGDRYEAAAVKSREVAEPTSGRGFESEARKPLDWELDVESWPRARDILCSTQGAASGVKRHPKAKVSRRAPEPTESRSPAGFQIKGRVWAMPAIAVVILAGGLMVRLSLLWSWDDQVAGEVARLVLEPAEGVEPPELPEFPGSSWWATTSRHLTIQAIGLSRFGEEGFQEEEIRERLEAARSVSPLEPSARYAMASVGSGTPLDHLGLSRDVLAYRKAGRELLEQGQVEAGLQAYRSALEMALESDPDCDEAPEFNEERPVNRYRLPLEALIDPIIGDLLAWNPAETGAWTEALPESAIVGLVLARRLEQRGSFEARPWFKRVSEMTISGEGRTAAVELAARAEALAMLEEWEAAGAGYQAAIKCSEPGEVCRTWLYNLAEVQARGGLFDEAKESWDLARVADLNDELNQRLTAARARHGQTVSRDERISAAAEQRDEMLERASHQEQPARVEIPELAPILEKESKNKSLTGAERALMP